MAAPKVVDRRIVFAFGAICVALLVGLIGAVVNYTGAINDITTTKNNEIQQKNSLIQNLTEQVGLCQVWLEGNQSLLEATIIEKGQYMSWLNGNITNYMQQIANLQNIIADLQAGSANLIILNLTIQDVRPPNGSNYLHVFSYVRNIGNSTAENSRLHITAHNSTGGMAIDGYALPVLTSIPRFTTVIIADDLAYVGEAITLITITPEWTT
jgi:hypothetical protein